MAQRANEAVSVPVPAEEATLAGDLEVPDGARGVVLFAHGSGSSRHSPRNRAVAAGLRRAGLATLLLDLLTGEEEQTDLVTAEYRFDIGLLGHRLTAAADWLGRHEDTASLPLHLFGASTGAAAALVAAARRPQSVHSVVSRGGRPDLAGEMLTAVRTPVLLVVGGQDQAVLRMNEDAARLLGGPHDILVVPGATHLFEEPGALEQVTDAAREWFLRPVPG